jgi:rubredoxin
VGDAVEAAEAPLAVYECDLCSHRYDEVAGDVRWADLADDWECPVCGSSKGNFTLIETAAPVPIFATGPTTIGEDYLAEWRRAADDFETQMADTCPVCNVSGSKFSEAT